MSPFITWSWSLLKSCHDRASSSPLLVAHWQNNVLAVYNCTRGCYSSHDCSIITLVIDGRVHNYTHHFCTSEVQIKEDSDKWGCTVLLFSCMYLSRNNFQGVIMPNINHSFLNKQELIHLKASLTSESISKPYGHCWLQRRIIITTSFKAGHRGISKSLERGMLPIIVRAKNLEPHLLITYIHMIMLMRYAQPNASALLM